MHSGKIILYLSLIIICMYLCSSLSSILQIYATSPAVRDKCDTQNENKFNIKKTNVTNVPKNARATLNSDKIPIYDNKSTLGSDFVIEKVSGGLRFSTAFAFVAKDDILALEKSTGQVRRIINGDLIAKPLIEVNVNTSTDRGLVGIAISKSQSSEQTYVFLYFTENLKNNNPMNNHGNVANRLYKYQLVDDELVKPKLLLDLPAYPSDIHSGGKIIIGPDDYLYLIIGDVGNSARSGTQNAVNHDGKVKPFDGTSGILRISQEGNSVRGIIAKDGIGQKYYAYGIRNGFGMDFDPVTGNLWDTENGPAYGDEINLVKPGFNSGWSKVQGIWKHTRDDFFPKKENVTYHPEGLVSFNGTGKYRSPELTLNKSVGLTAIKFLDSNKFGKAYENDMFVADVNHGNIYHFDLNGDRSELRLRGSLSDKVANNDCEIKRHIFLSGLGGITDIQVGPDGYMYFSTLGKPHSAVEKSPSSEGSIYRVKLIRR